MVVIPWKSHSCATQSGMQGSFYILAGGPTTVFISGQRCLKKRKEKTFDNITLGNK